MSESSNVWEAGDAESGASTAGAKAGAAGLGPTTDELPPVADLFMETIEDFKVNWKSHGLAGLGMVVVMFPAMIGIMLLGYVPFVAAVVAESEILLVAGALWMLVAFTFGIAVVMGPVMFAIFSIENTHLEGDTDALGFGGYFSRLFERPVGAAGYQLAASGLGVAGFFVFIIGAFVVQIALSMAMPAMVVHRLGVIAAISRSASHMKNHFVWHLGFWGLGFVVVAIAGNIPFVGYIFGMPFFAAYILRGYRAVFGGMDSDFAAY